VYSPNQNLIPLKSPNLCTRLWMDLDIVPIVFNIKPFHSKRSIYLMLTVFLTNVFLADSATRPNIKHRISSTTGSFAPSRMETPALYVESKPFTGNASQLQAGVSGRLPIPRTLDEQADSAARKCIMYFGPGNNPRLSIGPRNQVTVDAAGKIHLLDDLDEYKRTVGKGTWNAVVKLADELREKKVKIGFFSSTPQGGE